MKHHRWMVEKGVIMQIPMSFGDSLTVISAFWFEFPHLLIAPSLVTSRALSFLLKEGAIQEIHGTTND